MKVDLAGKFPQGILGIIKLAGKIADTKGIAIYIVGGVVRDILLGMPNYDLDFVVEGDAIEFSGILNGALKGDLKVHRAFGTATINYNNHRIDIVTARSESYKKPAAYPEVEPGTIKEDLFRRDFTINAMAISINDKGFGDVVDFYSGLKDLKKKAIRVMHPRSFIDDPTRVFRAVRFSARFGFKIEPHTKSLIKEAVSEGLLGEVNRGRINKEIELFLKEEQPLKCLKAFYNLI